MAATLDYIEGDGQQPRELTLLWNIERYGVRAVMGRSYLGVKEIRAMNAAEGVYDGYMSRKRYRDKDGNENWAEWTEKFPDLARLLTQAEVTREERS